MAKTRGPKKCVRGEVGSSKQGEQVPPSEDRAEELGEDQVEEETFQERLDEELVKKRVGDDGNSTQSPSRTDSELPIQGDPTGRDEGNTSILQPEMYFDPTEYTKVIKISTRCHIYETLTFLEQVFSPTDFRWFKDHPQFTHIVHMPRVKNHKLMGMWMFLLRTAKTEGKKEAWFVVNGVSIRYSIQKHALLSGLNCRNYPSGYMDVGSSEFANKHFKGVKSIRIQDVKEKLLGMGRTRQNDKLKMAVLYFLGNILIGQTKAGEYATPVHPFFVKAVNDLELCRTFPWGRLSFDHMLGEIAHTMRRFGGVVNDGALWSIPGIVIPLEILAFEAIPSLGNAFREPHPGADVKCPRMCKIQFKKSETRGFPLSKINDELSDYKPTRNVLVVREEEKALVGRITEVDDVVDNLEPVEEKAIGQVDY